MCNHSIGKSLALAVALALGTVSTAVMATAPAPGQLPGQGKVTLGSVSTVSVDSVAHTLTIPLAAVAVINWGQGTTSSDINSTGTAGFNVGAGAVVSFTGAYPVLNIDSTGNPSQIFGTLNSGKSKVFVANANGIIVGATAVLGGSGSLNFVANTLVDTAADFFANGTLTNYQGAGGDVTVQKGARKSGWATVLVSGGGTVNVDLTGGFSPYPITVSAGVKGGLNPLATDNTAASAFVVGAGNTLSTLRSAGTATTSGTLTITDASGVSGVLTNQGVLTLTAPIMDTVINNGELNTTGAATLTSLTNIGLFTAGGTLSLAGGNLINSGQLNAGGAISVQHGSIINLGSIDGVTSLATTSDSGVDTYSDTGNYSIDNFGSIAGVGDLSFDANRTGRVGTVNTSAGSFSNTGTLITAAGSSLKAWGYSGVSLGGALRVGTIASSSASSPTELLGVFDLVSTSGMTTVSTPLFFDSASGGSVSVYGAQVKLMSNIIGLDGLGGDPAGHVFINAGDALVDDYALRLASGKTVSADQIFVGNAAAVAGGRPNVILQGTLSANFIDLNPISDLFSGPAGSLVATGITPTINISFTGAVKTAKYNNSSNFRFNYLPISMTSGVAAPLQLTLDPTAYATNGTTNGGTSAVNVLVNGDVDLLQGPVLGSATILNGTSSAVTGVLNVPNTHLVVQSTGNITTPAAGYYWPGYVYLGNISADTTTGDALPGTLGLGTIALNGNFSNVLPGDVAGASGIHFMTGKPLISTRGVTTNANALINFPNDQLTQIYAQGLLTQPAFYGGVATGLIVNYGKLDASMFHTQAVDATK